MGPLWAYTPYIYPLNSLNAGFITRKIDRNTGFGEILVDEALEMAFGGEI